MNAADLIGTLGLAPHPEGGWYRETWRAQAAHGERAAGTLIHFLLETTQRSHWHRVDAAEMWLWHRGDPLTLKMAPTAEGPVIQTVLGPDLASGQVLQAVVPKDWWQAAEPVAGPEGYALASCVVTPGFEFAGFTLADAGWEPG
ncbi:cupin domain-containing protein [Novosphingobium cyanobacteriorum]|uniref:Cupin domain-containing protein n=1 Tax=Novosphingobium cyanobacteriorum TaxID=3024215 RepID=A0ABT6CJ77_9SPHN|nr:cupin domain-containing protein [Novosphingobium cyanobacteriorum]MDF8333969.1 cupin domain-containing protein [Novosphingobium cyanobacteriorum]